MKRSNRLVILVGVLLAVLAFVAIVILLNQQPDEVAPEDQTQTVLVATRDIAFGDPINPADVETLDVDPEAVQGTPLSDPSAVGGQPAQFAIPEGAQVSAEAIGRGSVDVVDIPSLLNPGEKAIAIRLDEQTGAGFLVRPGNTVDVVVSAEVEVLQPAAADPAAPTEGQRFEPIPDLDPTRTVKAVLQDKRVLYVSGTRAEQPEPQDTNGDGVIDGNDQQPAAAVIESVIVVIAGTAEDAEVIKWAQRDRSELSSERTEVARSISLIIRHNDDDAIEETLGITIDSLFQEYGFRIPGLVDLLPDEPAP